MTRRLLFVHAHPDDETLATGGTIAHYAARPDTTVTLDDIQAHCRERLGGYKIPRRLEVVDALPRNASGKVMKNILREPFWEGQDRRVGATADSDADSP